MPGASASGGPYNAGAPQYNPGGYSPQQPPYQPFGGNMPQPSNYGYAPAPAMAAPYASVGKRIAAVLLDGLVGMVAQIPGWIMFGLAIAFGVSNADASGTVRGGEAGAMLGLMLLGYALLFIGALGFAIYNIYLLGKTGSTLGKRWMKIKVLDPAGQPLGFWKALARELIKGFVGGLCFILLLWPLWDEQRQGLHDKLFNTHVYNA